MNKLSGVAADGDLCRALDNASDYAAIMIRLWKVES